MLIDGRQNFVPKQRADASSRRETRSSSKPRRFAGPKGWELRMGVVMASARYAVRRYRRTLARFTHALRRLEAEERHLHEVERAGESAETPYIAVLGLLLFLGPIFLLMVGIAFAAYYLAA
jgi:hypothetical protein